MDVVNPQEAGEGTEARIGTVVDKYTVVRLLGAGGMGAVYEARHAKLSRRFAIKFLLPECAKNKEILRRFENEAKAAGGLEHANLVAVTDLGHAADGAPYLVMEYLHGEDCAKLLRRLGPLPVARAVDIVVQACRGLAVAHAAGIVHRDLKPENLFLADAGDGSDLVKVVDFGIAKLRAADGGKVTSTGTTFGTAHYMSPEQARGASEVDQRTDVWSLGVVLYELLSGRKPFVGEQFLHIIHEILSSAPPPLASLRSGLPPALITVVERAMAKDAARRLPTVAALGEALRPFAGRGSRPVQEAVGIAPTLPTPPTAPRPSAPVAVVPSRSFTKPVVVGLLAVGAVTAFMVMRRSPERRADSGPVIAPVAPPLEAPPPAAAKQPAPPPPANVPAPPAVTRPPTPEVVRSKFEPSEHASNKPASQAPASRRTRKPSASATTPPPKTPSGTAVAPMPSRDVAGPAGTAPAQAPAKPPKPAEPWMMP